MIVNFLWCSFVVAMCTRTQKNLKHLGYGYFVDTTITKQ